MVINQNVKGQAGTVRAVAHDSTVPGAAAHISVNNQRVVPRPAEGQPYD